MIHHGGEAAKEVPLASALRHPTAASKAKPA
jgi:hypothetical protein